MVTVPMTDDGPDVDAVAALVKDGIEDSAGAFGSTAASFCFSNSLLLCPVAQSRDGKEASSLTPRAGIGA